VDRGSVERFQAGKGRRSFVAWRHHSWRHLEPHACENRQRLSSGVVVRCATSDGRADNGSRVVKGSLGVMSLCEPAGDKVEPVELQQSIEADPVGHRVIVTQGTMTSSMVGPPWVRR
jgi:hypothetical protein